MHDKMRFWQAPMNSFDYMHRQDIPVWLAGEFIRAMACPHRYSQRIYLCCPHKIHSLFRVSQKLVFR